MHAPTDRGTDGRTAVRNDLEQCIDSTSSLFLYLPFSLLTSRLLSSSLSLAAPINSSGKPFSVPLFHLCVSIREMRIAAPPVCYSPECAFFPLFFLSFPLSFLSPSLFLSLCCPCARCSRRPIRNEIASEPNSQPSSNVFLKYSRANKRREAKIRAIFSFLVSFLLFFLHRCFFFFLFFF